MYRFNCRRIVINILCHMIQYIVLIHNVLKCIIKFLSIMKFYITIACDKTNDHMKSLRSLKIGQFILNISIFII